MQSFLLISHLSLHILYYENLHISSVFVAFELISIHYIVPTSVINEKCGNNKTISIGRIRNLGFEAKRYDEIKSTIDGVIGLMSNN